ncbi:MAG: hypothetical protein ACR2JY_09295 [Chloroflexota bacterium]
MAFPSATVMTDMCSPCRGEACSISPWVRTALRLHWLLVADDGQVRLYLPEQQPELP